MSFLYPRIISVSRPIPTAGIGAIDPQVLEENNETLIAENIAANIQYDSTTQKIGANLPSDNYSGMRWKIFTSLMDTPKGLIKDNDIITDDEGIRYQVSAAYWNSMGCNLKCERLQN